MKCSCGYEGEFKMEWVGLANKTGIAKRDNLVKGYFCPRCGILRTKTSEPKKVLNKNLLKLFDGDKIDRKPGGLSVTMPVTRIRVGCSYGF